MSTPTSKNARILLGFKLGLPVAGALCFWALYAWYTPPQIQRLRPEGAGFSADLPCQTKSITSDLQSAVGKQSQTDYFCTNDGVSYTVGYTDIPKAVIVPLRKKQETAQLLEQYKLLMLERSQGQLRSGFSYPDNATYTIEVVAERGWSLLPRFLRKRHAAPVHTHVMRIQLHLQGERLYMMNVLQPDPPSYNQELYASRALRSFQLLNKPQS
ncbi:hypothetical protein ACFIQF_09270 [Comamonas sp. J-3]|jgi:hypothetical protein|uniref:hypothetical protein n=1 Tax=Comamonas trifloxystrobinivorans TaxID=3350256 RepID=UPI003727E46E